MRLLLGAKSVPFGCMSMERLGAKYAEVGCMYMESLGACMLLLGACIWSGWVQSMRLLGAKYAVVGCIYAETPWVQVCGCWVQVDGAVGCMPDCLCLPDSR